MITITSETLGEDVGTSLPNLDENVRAVVRTIQDMTAKGVDLISCAEEMRDASADAGDYIAAYIWARVLYLAEQEHA
jgi:DNA invertase Pin-like site-specific DNA recombinase